MKSLLTLQVKQGYTGYRPDILRILPDLPSGKVLDIGCGAGNTGRMLKEIRPDLVVTGVEQDAGLAREAENHLDKIHVLTVEQLVERAPFSGGFDIIILADILEHLAEPEQALATIVSWLSPDGYLVTSIPNVRHYTTFVYLYVFGTWPRNSRGIYDATHLRYFTRRNIVQMLEGAGLQVVKEHRNVRLVEKYAWTNVPGKLLDFWPFRGLLTFQYLHLCKQKSR